MNKNICYLCGGKAETVDHVPPKSFFPKPWPLNLLTVPCCTACNNGLSQLDEQMRMFLAADEHANDSARQIRFQKIFTENSVKRKSFRTVASTLKSFPVLVDGNLQTAHSLSASTKELYHFVERVIRGLAWKFYPEIYEPEDFVVVECISTVAFKDAKNAELVDASMKRICELTPKMKHDCFGDGVLDFLHQRADAGSGWFLSFYRGATFMGVHSKKAPPPELQSQPSAAPTGLE